eukprot:1153677-Pelagomonas_calceolata.AAC.4
MSLRRSCVVLGTCVLIAFSCNKEEQEKDMAIRIRGRGGRHSHGAGFLPEARGRDSLGKGTDWLKPRPFFPGY